MGAKRALIVDDSKSARLFLSRILVQHAIEVETVESAEEAIEYLTDHRPDVIFMDHQMGGMDGLQAVKLIKNNPVTATIPIMMYTSQEGELYLGQARALGAVGVMPKQIKQADVSKVLYELRLLPERRSREASGMEPTTLDALAEAAVAAERGMPSTHGMPGISEATLREQFAELRRALVASVETQSDRIVADFHAMLRDTPLFATTADKPPRTAQPWALGLASIALVVALASAMFWWQEARFHRTLNTQLAALRPVQSNAPPVSSTQRVVPVVPEKVDEAAARAAAKPVVIQVPYGVAPLSGPRLEAIRQLFHRLIAQKFRGAVDIRSFPGRFCLVGDAADGYSVAPDELPYSRCDAVGNPDAAELAQREPLSFANLVGELRNATRGAVEVRLSAGDAMTMLVPYPEVSRGLTAGEWNRAANTNNRIEIRVR